MDVLILVVAILAFLGLALRFLSYDPHRADRRRARREGPWE